VKGSLVGMMIARYETEEEVLSEWFEGGGAGF